MKENFASDNHNRIDGEIDLYDLFLVIMNGKWLIIAITFILSFLSIVYAIYQPNIYRSEALLAPAEQQQSNGLSALAGQFGGLASLAGVNLGDSGSNNTDLALAILKSRKFISEFIEKHSIMPDLMAIESWSSIDNTVIYDKNIYDEEARKWVRKVDFPFKPKPSTQEAYKEFIKMVSVTKDPESGMIIIGVEHFSPFIAQQWVNWLIEDINLTMKKRDVIEATKSTEFLMAQIEKTNVADIRVVLYKLVEEQAKTIMFANVREEYVFKTIDPALVPEEKLKPKRALIVIVSTFFAGVIGVFIVLIRFYISNNRRKS
ncbi:MULTISPECIES: Wzz/FepE/Etk N-terminal domain-containing protein [Pseudoalteromonas]|uniref:Wzz/FepE/Etk N-terminal domain-containing protein n=1 Tax=Pseudoalteromonas TaxID=53246 RepID=UPI0006DC8AB1|nr:MULTISPECIES: Wzz/FepE/Etk N-terminal domain-containing protein [Pseudoalteromonas]KPV96934.1 tyrosine kinase [Pseudoalteromonas sp. P1-8]MDK9684942.1 Wzz/FepE/Etk N-terminal domain-containing protein [Pseudoalteromonas shioyasakiensis]